MSRRAALRPSLRGAGRDLAAGGARPRALRSEAGRSFTRASGALAQTADGGWQEVGANVERIAYDPATLAPLGLLLEPQRTNAVRNPRAEGIVTGTVGPGGGTGTTNMPANWWLPNHTSGLALDISPVSYAGMAGVRLRYYGTVTGSSGTAETVEFEQRSAIPCTAGQKRAHSFFYRLAAGTFPAGVSFNTRTIAGNNNPGFSLVTNTSEPQTTPDATLRRAERSITMNAALTTNPTVVHGAHMTGWTTGTVLDFTVDLFSPQSEPDAEFCTSPILPPAGSPAASTRAEDNLQLPLAALAGLPPVFTLLVRWRDLATSQPTANLGVLALTDGTSNNRIMAFQAAGADTIAAVVRKAGVGAGPVSVGPVKRDGSWNSYALTRRADGIAHSLNGGAARAVAVACPELAALTDGLRALSRAPGAEPYPSQMAVATIYPRPMADAALQALTAGA